MKRAIGIIFLFWAFWQSLAALGQPPGVSAGQIPASPPGVVASIKPIHSLVSGVMEGAGAPALLIKGTASPHAYRLRPSEARALQEARLVFWVGDKAEAFLSKSLAVIARRAERVRLLNSPGLILYPARRGGAPHRDGVREERKTRSGHLVDPHIWLDPGNAKILISAIASALVRADPPRRALYRANEIKMARRLDALDGDIRTKLDPVLRRPYVVFHDAFQYFEKRYGLNMVGAITTSPERRPGAKRIAGIRARIRAQIGARGAVCVFTEPQFTPSLARVVLEGTGARMGALDPLGAALPPDPGMYFALMRGLAASLLECLAS